MPFDLEDVLPGLDVPRFKATPANAQQPDDVAGVVHCNCPVCSGALSIIEGVPTDPQNFLNAEERGGTAGGKPSLTIPEAAVQLNRTYASWNDFYIQPGVSDENNHWDDPYWGGAPSVVTFAFRSTAPGAMPDDTAGFSRFNTAQINATLLALQSWADVANVVFVRVGEGTSGNAAYSNNATILLGNYSSGSDGAAAFAYFPSPNAEGGDVWVNSTLSYNQNPTLGNYGMLTLVHELGHAIGFSHPGEYNAGEGDGPITYAADAEYYEDSQQYTVMSYFTENNTGANYGVYYPAAPQLDDIAAAQRTYGVNTTTRTGDTVYGFNSTADRPWFSITVGSSAAVIFAVWDAGGVDTLDFSGYGQNQKIDLQQGHFSNVGSWTGNVAIAMGAVIENAIGGSGADTLIGNSAVNRLTGNGGADTLTGGAGADVFVVTVSGGTDTVTDFAVGSDKIDLTVFGAYASITQNGLNTVVAFTGGVSITLLNVTASTVTNASFIGLPSSYNVINGTASAETISGTAAADQIFGLAGDDVLNGAGADDWLEGGADNDTLNGGAGADILKGGAGNDIYVVDDAGDAITELAGEGTDTVQTSLAAYTLSAQLENLTGTSASGQTLTGNGGVNAIIGGSGADTLNGLGGADAMTGGGGNDTYVVDNAGDTTVELAGGGVDTVQTALAAYTLAAEVENLTGTSAGGQALTGNSANNAIVGAGGADTLTGGAGTDTLTGGGGADVFVVTVGGGADTVTDFVVGTDKIDISAFGAYQTIVQSGADTLITVAAGVTLRLTGVTASTVTNASFVGLPSGPNVITGTAAANTLNGTSGADHIFALAGNDTVHGLGADDWIEGAEGLDKLYGDEGADKLEGGDGNDTLDGGAGADALIGGAGDDTYVVDSAGDVVTEAAAAGTDTVQTTLTAYTLGANLENLTGTLGGAQTLTGNAANNTITGGAGADTLAGVDGDDRLFGGLGADSLDGGLGVDTLYGEEGADSLTGGAGIDNLYGGADNDTLTGGADLDRLYGEDGDDTLSGDDGNDVIQGAAGADRITGGAGNDTVTGGDGADVFVATVGGGADTVMDFVVGTDRIDATAFGSYQSIAQSAADTLITFATGVTMRLKGITASTVTNDSFIGLTPGYNLITGTAAGETLNGSAAADHIVSLGGADTLNGAGADDWLEGGEGDDTLNGGAGSDSLTGGAGADVFVATGGGGADTVTDFVVGTDRIDVSAFGSIVGVTQQGADALVTVATGVTFLLLNTTASVVTSASFIGLASTGYNEIVGTGVGETLNGTAAADHIQGLGGADILHGLDQNDVLDGGEGDDELYGDAGNDTLNGGAGADRLEGGLGADILVGGDGHDIYIVQDADDTVTEQANEGNDEVFFSGVGSYTLGANVENVHGLSSTGQTLIGNGGFNYLMAGSGADVLRGEGGADYLSGGAGADTFVATVGGGADQVADFVVGTDRLDVSAFGAYQSIVQQGADTLVTVSAGVTFLLLGVTASTVTAGSFIGIAPTGYTVINGTAATETLNGTVGADHIFGFGGVDTVRAGDGNDWIEGGDDDDRLYGDGGNDLIQGGDGADQAFGRLGDDDIDGGVGADKLYGDEGADDIVGGLGADYLYGGADNDVLSGGDDIDRLYGDDGADVIDGDAGNDIVQGGAGDDRITGGAGNDTITGGAGADVHVATLGGGADTVIDFVVGTDRIDLTAFGGYQTIAQVNADTVITFAAGVTMKLIGVTASALTEASFIGLPSPPTYNLINGTGAAETLNGTAAADEIHGLAGADILIGGAADDLLFGGADGDTFVATVGGGADTVSDFTVGADRIDVSAFGSIVGVTQQGADALVTVSAGVTFLLLGVSAGAVGADSFIGLPAGPLYNEINGTAANETITGTASADHVLAGDGTDRVYGAGGGDWLEGDLGSDLLYGDGGDDLLEGGDGVDQIWGGLGLDTANGGIGNDKLYGEDGDDTLNGDAGGDFLYGGEGLDTLNGGDDVDRLYGDAGDDGLNGGLGNDLIYGGAGSDVMTGGGGNDTFYILGEGDFGPLGAPDRITDWTAGDKINLTAVDANTALAGDQAFAIVSAFTNAAGQLVSTYNSGTNETLVQLDVNGDSVADYSLIVGGQITAAGWVL